MPPYMRPQDVYSPMARLGQTIQGGATALAMGTGELLKAMRSKDFIRTALKDANRVFDTNLEAPPNASPEKVASMIAGLKLIKDRMNELKRENPDAVLPDIKNYWQPGLDFKTAQSVIQDINRRSKEFKVGQARQKAKGLVSAAESSGFEGAPDVQFQNPITGQTQAGEGIHPGDPMLDPFRKEIPESEYALREKRQRGQRILREDMTKGLVKTGAAGQMPEAELRRVESAYPSSAELEMERIRRQQSGRSGGGKAVDSIHDYLDKQINLLRDDYRQARQEKRYDYAQKIYNRMRGLQEARRWAMKKGITYADPASINQINIRADKWSKENEKRIQREAEMDFKRRDAESVKPMIESILAKPVKKLWFSGKEAERKKDMEAKRKEIEQVLWDYSLSPDEYFKIMKQDNPFTNAIETYGEYETGGQYGQEQRGPTPQQPKPGTVPLTLRDRQMISWANKQLKLPNDDPKYIKAQRILNALYALGKL